MFFHIVHLKDLVRQGRWNDAIKYVFRFVPSVDRYMLGEEFRVFFSFLHVHRDLDSIAAGNSHGAVVARFYLLNLKRTSHTGAVRLARMVLALHRSEQLRCAIDSSQPTRRDMILLLQTCHYASLQHKFFGFMIEHLFL